ncbi:MAG: hypothetical protein IH586_13550, partial [Anaerolineaceae bacterium]|nr:hypothetical protein [Anaerolineaceae bacterium]
MSCAALRLIQLILVGEDSVPQQAEGVLGMPTEDGIQADQGHFGRAKGAVDDQRRTGSGGSGPGGPVAGDDEGAGAVTRGDLHARAQVGEIDRRVGDGVIIGAEPGRERVAQVVLHLDNGVGIRLGGGQAGGEDPGVDGELRTGAGQANVVTAGGEEGLHGALAGSAETGVAAALV